MVALSGAHPEGQRKLQNVMMITDVLAPFWQSPHSKKGRCHEKDSRNSASSLHAHHRRGTDNGLCPVRFYLLKSFPWCVSLPRKASPVGVIFLPYYSWLAVVVGEAVYCYWTFRQLQGALTHEGPWKYNLCVRLCCGCDRSWNWRCRLLVRPPPIDCIALLGGIGGHSLASRLRIFVRSGSSLG